MGDSETRAYTREPFNLTDFLQFKLYERRFDRQYASIYLARLAELKEPVSEAARTKWGERKIVTLAQLVDQDAIDTCVVIGTLYKHQVLKPSILQELSDELQLVAQPLRQSYASVTDLLFLEDESLRVKLVFNNLDLQSLVTGLVCGLLGHVLDNGTFQVLDYCFPGCPLQSNTVLSNKEEKILLISGLDVTNVPESLSMHLLSEWVTGMIGNNQSQKQAASLVCIIIAGNSLKGALETHNHKGYFDTKARTEVKLKETTISAHRLDNFLHSIVRVCPVILMPGEFDPVCHTLPQQPIHPCILPCSARLTSLHGATNPWIGKINSRVIAGSSGQPVQDLSKVTGLADVTPLSWMERTLTWRHFAPTAPDTLPAYPYFENDPFIMRDCPDIYFVGNVGSYESKLLRADEGQTVRLVCVPKFSETRMGVLINLHDLDACPISFGDA